MKPQEKLILKAFMDFKRPKRIKDVYDWYFRELLFLLLRSRASGDIRDFDTRIYKFSIFLKLHAIELQSKNVFFSFIFMYLPNQPSFPNYALKQMSA